MKQEAPRITPLRRRMIDDMRMRKLQEKTQIGYIRAVRKLAAFLGRSPDTATAEDLRRFQLYLVESGCSPITLNATITGLKFFFDVTVGRFEVMAKMQSVHVPQKIPVVLSREEVAHLLAAVHNVKHHTALSVAYGARPAPARDLPAAAGSTAGRAARVWDCDSSCDADDDTHPAFLP